ncbi:transcriptional regulator [Sphaerisporangium melleum]|uniref:Transcriptional regulator n=1 Tax=Sphaerisporangium melleum TaxID=321316 RepID=A0A917RB60_9ACTN|nr:helix-turn-helix domain-containing protein [Sphaerisporangium melleum]GGK98306.1 transcriptional regulator [Sphaerisporangium melleum]GII73725.1 transcriptional regulator [Sphaerisporangium melleum]
MDVDVAAAAGLFSDRTRADVVAALLDGRALTAGELARLAGVSAPTVSSHLRRLLDAGLLAVETQGRHRYYRLSDERVGRAFEALAALAPVRPVRSLRQSRGAEALRTARTCYDHLAGRVAVLLAEALIEEAVLVRHADGYTLGAAGEERLTAFGLDVAALGRSRRSFAHPCLDWSERRHHVAGALGAALLTHMIDLGWLDRHPRNRAVRIRPAARQGLSQAFGCDLPDQPVVA